MGSGRKRKFDENTALNAAMNVFWKKGYVGSSLTDLTQSMGINKPSMYSAFGNKEALFIKATQHYIETVLKSRLSILHDPNTSLMTRLKNYMMSVVAMQCDSEQQKGCYLVLCQSELVGGEIPEEAKRLLIEIDEMPLQLFTNIFQTDQEAIELGLDNNAESNALSLYTLLKGTAAMARSGIAMAKLEGAVDNILKGISKH